MNNTLFSAKRSLENAVDAVKKAVRPNYAAINRESPLDYFFATAANKGAFQKRIAAIQKADYMPESAANLVIHAVTEYQRVEELVAAEKSRLTSKRAAVAAKAALKSDLNLQEGVSLKGVDVGQYTVILSGLEPVRLHVYKRQIEILTRHRDNLVQAMVTAQWDATKAFPSGRENNWAPLPEHFSAFFTNASNRNYFTQRGELEVLAYIRAKATQFALAYVQGYAAKLALKTGEALANDALLTGQNLAVHRAEVSTMNLWRDSLARIHLDGGTILKFHTQIIWNRSCLGKVFNQYPTRRVE